MLADNVLQLECNNSVFFLLIWWQYLELLRNVGCICPTIKNHGSDHVNYILDWFRWWIYNFRNQLYFYQLVCFWAKLLKWLHSVNAVSLYIFLQCYSPRVAFCGYSIPHPADRKINIRVHTTGTKKWNIMLTFWCFL